MIMADNGTSAKSISFYMWAVVSPILLVVGTIGNVISILVMSRRTMRTSQSSVYLIALAVADILVLYTGLLRQYLRELTGVDIRTLSTLSCKINIMMVYASLDISVWILVAFTFERILSVFIPYKVKNYCTRLSSILIIVGIIVVLLGLNSHFLYGYGDIHYTILNITYVYRCAPIFTNYKEFFSHYWPWIDFTVYSLAPSIILIIGNTCIAVRVFISKRKVRRNVGVATMETLQITHLQTPAVSMAYRTGLNSPTRTTVKTDRTSSMTVILLMLNLVFLITTLPVSVFLIVQPDLVKAIKTQKELENNHLLFTVVNLIQYCNNSINFILYCITGSRFRRELYIMFFRRRQQMRVMPVPAEGQERGPGGRVPVQHVRRTTATSDVPLSPTGLMGEDCNMNTAQQQPEKRDETQV